MISEIKGQSITLAKNHQKIEKLEHDLKLYGGIAIAIITSLITGLIIALWDKLFPSTPSMLYIIDFFYQ